MHAKKILIINKFLYPRGGDCIYTLNLGELLKQNGHEVMYFSMLYPENLSFEESNYFVDEVSFASPGINNKAKAALRIFGSGVKERFNAVLDNFRPDVVHLNNIHSYISPIVAKLAHKRGIKVVWTLHDYKLICPSYSCLRDGKPCEICYKNKLHVVTNKCFKGSTVASTLAYLEAICWNRSKLTKWVDTFICPSNFMASKMMSAGFPENKIVVLNNFIDKQKVELICATKQEPEEKSYCYVGRLSPEKGIQSLLEVASDLPYKLYVAGTGPLEDELKRKYASKQIVFLGFQTSLEIVALMKKVHFSVIPSAWYENNPLSVIESLCCGTKVLGASIGGIPELIKEGDGQLFEAFDNAMMKGQIENMFNDTYNREEVSNRSIKKFSEERYYADLLTVYEN
ncbi:glycosyltransferase [Bacteroides sp. 214]|uniref:glycosyltransferase n=1 Tax=Bacteroides sp. 214 TaxID=2302935 RepID=UPI0013D4B893|nr:glycosyltransferase [Bacteroides sp. 214]NDW12967.1 glycosyltransferase [Bacteroides sp. 214]